MGKTESKSGSSGGAGGCGCITLIATILVVWAWWFGLPIGSHTLNIDIFPPAIHWTADAAKPEGN